MNKVIEIFVDTVIVWIVEYFAGKILLDNDNSENKSFKIILIIIIWSVLLTVINVMNFEFFNGVIKILCGYLLETFFYKIMFNKTLSKSMLVALIWYLFLIISEALLGITATVILSSFNISAAVLKNNIIMNTLIPLFDLLLIYKFRKRLALFIKNNKYIEKGLIIVICAILIIFALIGFKRPIGNWKIDGELILSTIMLLCFGIIGIYLLKQKSNIQKTSSRYQEVVKYSNTTNKLLEDYRMVNHEHKNQLSIIRQMINKNSNDLNEYIDSLIEKHNDIKYKWVADLNNIPDEGLRGLINYKLLEVEDNKINVTVIISKEISKIKLNSLNTREKDELYSIIGVYLDNAIQAAKESKDKEISLEIYKDKKDIVFILGNTYKGNIDIKRIDNYGYSTKGKNHGVGLHIVKNILNGNFLFSQSREILDKFYIQHLVLHTSNIKNNKNKTTIW